MDAITLIIVGLLLIVVLYIPFPFAVQRLMRRKFLATVRKSGLACLTFDDGPCPETTPQLLALLKRNGIKATFFLVGEKVARYPNLVDKIVADGHQIGEHSYSHSHPWKCSPWRSAADLIKGGQALKRYKVFQRCACFRPPYGKFNFVTLLYVWITKKRVAFWDLDPKDYQGRSGEQVAQKILEQLRSGAVVLLHDGRQGRNGSMVHVTVEATQLTLEALTRNQLRFATIEQALSRK